MSTNQSAYWGQRPWHFTSCFGLFWWGRWPACLLHCTVPGNVICVHSPVRRKHQFFAIHVKRGKHSSFFTSTAFLVHEHFLLSTRSYSELLSFFFLFDWFLLNINAFGFHFEFPLARCEIFSVVLIGRLNSVGFGVKSALIYVLAFDTTGSGLHGYRPRIRFLRRWRDLTDGAVGFIALSVNSERAFVIHPTNTAPQIL